MKKKKKIDIFMVLLITGALFMTGIVMYVQLQLLENYRSSETENYLQIAGAMNESEEKEAVWSIIAALRNADDPALIETGRSQLKQYGLLEDVITARDREAAAMQRTTLLLWLLCALILLVAALLFRQHYNRKLSREYEELVRITSQMIDGDYSWSVPFHRAGIRYRLLHNLEHLCNIISLSMNRLQQEKEDTKALVTDVSHQLKTPLAALEMCHMLLAEEDLTASEQQEFLTRAGTQTKKLGLLIQALVNISRLEAGMIQIKAEMADIRDTIIQAVNTVYPKADARNIQIHLNLDETAEFPHDPHWMSEAFTNILENSIKYSPSGTEITITTTLLRNYIRIEFEDQGPGIPKEEYNNIFRRFYRGRQDIVKNTEGSGVGLYLTRKIIEEQGGSIRAAAGRTGGAAFILHVDRYPL